MNPILMPSGVFKFDSNVLHDIDHLCHQQKCFDPEINRINMNIYILIYPCNINWNIYWGQQQVVTWFNSILDILKTDIYGASIDVQKDKNEG